MHILASTCVGRDAKGMVVALWTTEPQESDVSDDDNDAIPA